MITKSKHGTLYTLSTEKSTLSRNKQDHHLRRNIMSEMRDNNDSDKGEIRKTETAFRQVTTEEGHCSGMDRRIGRGDSE